jgi:hypothetical protein
MRNKPEVFMSVVNGVQYLQCEGDSYFLMRKQNGHWVLVDRKASAEIIDVTLGKDFEKAKIRATKWVQKNTPMRKTKPARSPL